MRQRERVRPLRFRAATSAARARDWHAQCEFAPYMQQTLGEVHVMGELKVDGRIRTTEELHEENVRKQHEVEARLAAGGLDD